VKVDVCLLFAKLIGHQRHFQLWHRVVWQICTNISEYLPPPSSGWCRRHVHLRRCYISTILQWLDQGDRQNILITTFRTSDLVVYDTQQVLEISSKIWLMWDCKFRYLIVASSLIVMVSVTRSEGVTVCLWLRSELLSRVTCLTCWDVTLIDMCQDCWAQEIQT